MALTDLGRGLRAAAGVFSPRIDQLNRAERLQKEQLAIAQQNRQQDIAREQRNLAFKTNLTMAANQIKAIDDALTKTADEATRQQLIQQKAQILQQVEQAKQQLISSPDVGTPMATPELFTDAQVTPSNQQVQGVQIDQVQSQPTGADGVFAPPFINQSGEIIPATDINPNAPKGLFVVRNPNGNITPIKTPVSGSESPFGSGIVGKSQAILMRIAQKEKQGLPLSPVEKMQKAFAVSNLTQEQVQFRTDPNTGEQYQITIKPKLPDEIASIVNQGTYDSGGAVVKPLDIGGGPSRKSRQDAEAIIRDFSNARKQAEELAKFVTENPDVTGARGLANRVISGVAGQVGIDADTKAKEFERRLELLRSNMRVLIDKGKFSDEDRKRLENLVSGTGLLDDPKSTAEGFVQLIQEIDRQLQSARDILGQNQQEVPKDIIDKVNEQARINNWNDEEKQRAINILMGNQ